MEVTSMIIKQTKKNYTVAQVSKYLDISKTTTLRLLKTGELEGFQLCNNGTWKIPEDNLEDFIKKHTPHHK